MQQVVATVYESQTILKFQCFTATSGCVIKLTAFLLSSRCSKHEADIVSVAYISMSTPVFSIKNIDQTSLRQRLRSYYIYFIVYLFKKYSKI